MAKKQSKPASKAKQIKNKKWSPKNQSMFTARNFIIFILGFGIIGAIVLLYSSAGPTTILNLQAETLTGSGVVLADTNAYSSKALKLTTITPAQGAINLPANASKMLLKARGVSCGGTAPQAKITIDGREALLASVTSSTYALYISNPRIIAGPHTLAAQLTNPLVGASCTRQLIIDVIYMERPTDTSAPTVAIASPTNTTTVKDTVTVTATATDNTAVARVEFFVSSTSQNVGNAVGVDDIAPYAYAWTTATIPDSTYVLTARAYDNAGNVASSSVSVKVNNSPSGEAMPVGDLPGWKQTFTDDFTTDAPLGTFSTVYNTNWRSYSGGDTMGRRLPSKKSEYKTSQVVSVKAGILDKFLHSATDTGYDGYGTYMMSAAIVPRIPGQLYGRYTVRLRSDAVDGYKIAWLMWPDTGTNTTGSPSGVGGNGEIDFAETNLTDNLKAFIHYQDGTSGSDQTACRTSNPAVYLSSGWHTVTLEWDTTTSIYVDGVLECSSSTRIPNTPMHPVLQTESMLVSTVSRAEGHLDLDWVAVYAKQ